MFKNKIWKYIMISLAWTVSLGGLVVLLSFIAVKKEEVVCSKIQVFIPGTQYFIDKKEVDHILMAYNSKLIGSRLEDINIQELEDRLKANPFIEYAKIYADMDGTIYVDIDQREPVLRIMNRYGQDFYVDRHGVKMPLSLNFTARVLAANGNIDEPFADRPDTLRTALAKDLFKTAGYISKDSLWDAQIAQMYVNQQHEIELVPRVGNNRILLGDADSLENKFGNLLAFYKKALPRIGWGTYKIINIKYANQVIGVRNEAAGKDSLKKKPVGLDSAKVKNGTSLIKK